MVRCQPLPWGKLGERALGAGAANPKIHAAPADDSSHARVTRVAWFPLRPPAACVMRLTSVSLAGLPCDIHGAFPRETVRDLLGITRALYRAELAARPPHADPRRIEHLEAIGKQLRLALDLATRCGPGPLGRRAAWSHAEPATAALGEYVSGALLLDDAVRATALKLRQR